MERKRYDLKKGFELVPAEMEEFAKFYVVYKLEKVNMLFQSSRKDAINLYVNLFKDPYWIYLNGVRVGGALVEPNFLGLVFIISPYQDELTLINQLVQFVQTISDVSKPITAFGVHEFSVTHFQKCGFQIVSSEKSMVCPTSHHEIIWGDHILCDHPRKEDLSELIELYFEVFSQSKVKSIAEQTHEFYEDLLKSQIDAFHPEYSIVIRDQLTKELVGSCSVMIWYGMLHITDLVVKTPYQGQGLGKKMVHYVLNAAKDEFYAAVLDVVPGNPAEYFYHRLGFISGVESYTMELK